MEWLLFIALGIAAGAISGVVGIGGGVVVVPALVFLFGFSQKLAQGTTLALLIPPIGLLAVLTYWHQGLVNFKAAGFIIAGFLLGSLLGARFAVHTSGVTMARIFGALLLALGLKMLIKP